MFGLISYETSAPRSFAIVSFLMLSSSRMCASNRRSAFACVSSAGTTIISLSGRRTRNCRASRSASAAETICIAASISRLSASSWSAGSGCG